MASKRLFFCLCVYHPHQPHFKGKILLNFVRVNEAIEDGQHKKQKNNYIAAIYEYGLFCKRYLEEQNKAPNMAGRAELGKYPIGVDINKEILIYLKLSTR